MAIDMTLKHSRRAILATALTSFAAALSLTVGRVMAVTASDGDPLTLGQENTSAGATSLTRVGSGPALIANGTGPGVGCSGTSQSGIAVYGVAQSGHGVVSSSQNGSGVEAISPHRVALRVRQGRIRADGVSGVVRIPKDQSSVTIEPAVSVVRDAFVLLTPMANLAGRDLWFDTEPRQGTFTIQVSTPVDVDTNIGWFLMG